MDIAQQLIRSVMRAFYDTRQILVIDALLIHSTLTVEDLAFVLGMNTKDTRKLCQPLREDRLVSVHTRPEMRAGQQRPTNKDYYYVHFHMAIDAIKYRIVKLQQMVQARYKPTQERKEYQCGRCKAEWAELDILAHVDMSTGDFLCPNCGFVLDRPEISAEDASGSARTSRLNEQIKPLVLLLKKVDNTEIPANDFEDAHSRHKAIERSDLNPAVEWQAVKKEGVNDTVRGIKIEAPKVQVEITSTEESEKKAEEQKRKKAEQQAANALPEWYTKSTVTGEQNTLGEQEAERMRGIHAKLGSGTVVEEDKKPVEEENEHVRAYYEELRRAQMQEAAEESSDEGDDDEGFEDVMPGMVGTPASTASTNALKRRADDSGPESGVNTGVSTPAGFDSPAKKIKSEAADEADGDDDDDDDVDFEDAL